MTLREQMKGYMALEKAPVDPPMKIFCCRVCEKKQHNGGVVIQTWLPFFDIRVAQFGLKEPFRH